MSLTERSRTALYRGLVRAVEDEEAVGEMLAHFPARDADEPATRDHLQIEVAALRLEMHDGFASVRAEMHGEFASVRAEMAEGFAAQDRKMAEAFGVRDRWMAERFAEQDRRISDRFAEQDRRMSDGLASVREDLTAEMHRLFLWTLGVMVTLFGLTLTVLALVARSSPG